MQDATAVFWSKRGEKVVYMSLDDPPLSDAWHIRFNLVDERIDAYAALATSDGPAFDLPPTISLLTLD